MKRTFDMRALMRRMVEIDYRHKHRHLPGSLSALPIIASVYADMDLENDVFILSKGHSCAALYAVLEQVGYVPDVSLVHPDRDPGNGVTMTAGSLGHGLPTAVGVAWAKQHTSAPGLVHVLIGDGECQEGTTYEALLLAARFQLHSRLIVHLDANGYQGSDACLVDCIRHLTPIYPVRVHHTKKGAGLRMFEDNPIKSVHLVTDADYAELQKEIG